MQCNWQPFKYWAFCRVHWALYPAPKFNLQVKIVCVLCGKNVAFRWLSGILGIVMRKTIHVVNLIKARSVNNRIFSHMSSDKVSNNMCLLYHSKIRWLSQGNTVHWVVLPQWGGIRFCKKKKELSPVSEVVEYQVYILISQSFRCVSRNK
jgi:hypothetical protein